MKILVADDDSTSRLIVQTALRSLGHECHIVSDGGQAWEAFQTHRPDVVISDWMMPGLTGLELCRNIRADASGAYTFIIMVTSQGGHDEILEGMSAGADDYLIKPLDSDDLQAHLIAASRVTSLHLQLAEQRAQLEGLNEELAAIARRDPSPDSQPRALERISICSRRASLATGIATAWRCSTSTCSSPTTTLRSPGRRPDPAGRRRQAPGTGSRRRRLYRYGGEEFLCIFPEQSLATGTLAVERMRISLKRLAIPHADNPFGVLTISAGMSMMDPGHTRSGERGPQGSGRGAVSGQATGPQPCGTTRRPAGLSDVQ